MDDIIVNSRFSELVKNRYNSLSQAPFLLHIENSISDENNANIGNMDPLKLGQLLIAQHVNFDNVRRIGPRKIELTFSNLTDANQLVEKPANLPEGWVPYIPNYKVLKIGQVHGIDPSYSIDKLTLAIESKYKGEKIERIFKKIDEVLTPTNTIKIFFHTNSLPEQVKFFGVTVKVYPYVFNVLQCKRCYRFGHSLNNCSRNSACPECSNEHTVANEKCNLSKRCINCKGNHSALDKSCLKFIEQKEIKHAMATKNISLSHAKNLFNSGCLNHYKENSSLRPYSESLLNNRALQSDPSCLQTLNKRRRTNPPIVQFDDDESINQNISDPMEPSKSNVPQSQDTSNNNISILLQAVNSLIQQNIKMNSAVFSLIEAISKEKNIPNSITNGN